jgi:uncharacterized phiE125 gp8 family phage protein
MLTIVTPATSYDLTVIETVRAELGITYRSEDENLARWITQASNIVARYCNRVFARETIAETFRLATRESDLLLSRYPVQSITSVQENDETLAATDYEVKLENGVLTRLRDDSPACWSLGKIVVTYTAGYPLLGDLPYGIERAAITLVKQYRFANARDPQLRSENVDGIGSAGYFDGLEADGLSPEVRGLLAEHRKPAGG